MDSEKRVVWAPPFIAPMLGDAYEIVQTPNDPAARAAFVRDIAPRIEAAATFGNAMGQDVLDAAKNLKLIALFSAGYDTFDPAALKARGITLTNASGVNATDVADVAIGLMISVLRGVAAGDARVRSGQFRGGGGQSKRIRGRKFAVVGLGEIGRAAAERAKAFGMDVAWTGPRPKPDAPYPYNPSLLDLARWCDVLCVCTRADPGTEKLIGAAVIEAIGPDGVLVNISRGSVVDEDALIAALRDKRIGGAGLDVFAQEPTPAERWKDVPNTTLTPHFGGGTRESLQEAFALVADNIRRHFAGESLRNIVT
jgi:lactate dehydrogenase-like 2-hydroxyacid dehydrogenase